MNQVPPEVRVAPTVVLGIDPGTLVMGYGAIVIGARGPRLYAAGVLRAPRTAAIHERLGSMRRQLDELLAKLAPHVVVVEAAFAARNVQSALRIGEGRGVVLCCAVAYGASVVQFAPSVAKKALVGHGGADKSQVAKMVARALKIEELDLPLDASDALALALAHAHRGPAERMRESAVDAKIESLARRPRRARTD